MHKLFTNKYQAAINQPHLFKLFDSCYELISSFYSSIIAQTLTNEHSFERRLKTDDSFKHLFLIFGLKTESELPLICR